MGKDTRHSKPWEESSEDRERETLNPFTNHTTSIESPLADLEWPIMPRDMDTSRESSRTSFTTQAEVPLLPWSNTTTATTTERPTSTSSPARVFTSVNTFTAVPRPYSPPETSSP